MSEPIVFISHFKVKEGKINDLKQFAQTTSEQIQTDKPGTLVFLQFLNKEGTEQSVIHVFLDAEAMDRHLEGVAARAKAAFKFIELTRREIYGMPSDKALAMSRPPDGSGSTLNYMPELMGGYIRFKPV